MSDYKRNIQPGIPTSVPRVGNILQPDVFDRVVDTILKARRSRKAKHNVTLTEGKNLSTELDPSETEVLYSASDFAEYLLHSFLKRNLLQKVDVRRHQKKSIWVRAENASEMLDLLAKKYSLNITQDSSKTFLINDVVFICLNATKGEFIGIRIYSVSKELSEEIIKDVDSFSCTANQLSFEWIYSPEGHSMTITEEWDETVDASLYPNIQDFDTFTKRFIESKSNILILQGPPGTGKTTLIKHLMLAMNNKAYVTYDSRVLSNDGSFARYMEDSSAGAFIIEDADTFLKSRAEGNEMVSRFLNVGDGLIKLKNKKLIFSTNLPNLNDIDSALIRPGRCFGIINFRALTRDEAQVVADKRGFTLEADKKTFTVAEIFNSPVLKKEEAKFGFC
jgi:SpoVK/Ycf46/Vps4 family AAA+-type ATPase